MTVHLGIINYGMGNLASVAHAIDHLGYSATLVQQPDQLEHCSHAILPGVGSFYQAMHNLHQQNWGGAITAFVQQGRPLLGICLGMQLFATTGFESGTAPGLNLIPGTVVPMSPAQGQCIPHVGWNTLHWLQPHPITDGVRKAVDVYFVHSHHFVAQPMQPILATTDFAGQTVAAIAYQNCVGLQFHPEKSQDVGLTLLDNFCCWDGLC